MLVVECLRLLSSLLFPQKLGNPGGTSSCQLPIVSYGILYFLKIKAKTQIYSKRQRAEGRGQKAEGRRQKGKD